VVAKVSFTTSEKDPALRVTKVAADCNYLHRNLTLDFINGKTKKAVVSPVSVIKSDTLKALIESTQEMDKSDLKKDFLEFDAYLEKMAIIHDDHCHVLDHKKTGDFGTKNMGTNGNAGGRGSGHNPGGIFLEVIAIRRLSAIERSPVMEGRRTRLALESSLHGSLRLALTQKKSVQAKIII
jgi:hypothetical protein